MSINIYKNKDQVPEYSPDHPLWNVLYSDELANICLMQIMNELGADVAAMTEAQCRTVLSRVQAHFNTMMLSESLREFLNSKEYIEED